MHSGNATTQNDDFAGRQFLYPFERVTGDFDADRQLTINDVDLLIIEINAENVNVLQNDGTLLLKNIVLERRISPAFWIATAVFAGVLKALFLLTEKENPAN